MKICFFTPYSVLSTIILYSRLGHWLGDWEHLEPMMQQLHSFLLFCSCDDDSMCAIFKPSYISKYRVVYSSTRTSWSSLGYLSLIFPSTSQCSHMNLSSWSDQRWCSAPYLKEGRRIQKPLVYLPTNRGFFSLCEVIMSFSSNQLNMSWKEKSSSDIPVNLSMIFFPVHQNIWADLWTHDQFWSAIQLCPNMCL